MKHYSMRNSFGILYTIFRADNLARAVALKHRIQRQHNSDWGADEIFTIAVATPRDVRTLPAYAFFDPNAEETDESVH
jgi:hypothetical protein